MTDDQIKHMVERFLQWKLPDDFHPDAGISFKPTYNEHAGLGVGPMRHEPVGTNLLNYTQAEAMVRHMLEGLPPAMTDDVTVSGTGEVSPEEIAANIVGEWSIAKDETFPELRQRIALVIRRARSQGAEAMRETIALWHEWQSIAEQSRERGDVHAECADVIRALPVPPPSSPEPQKGTT